SRTSLDRGEELPLLPFCLERNRWKVGTSGFVVNADAHQRHRFHDAQALLEAPAEQSGVARGNKHARAEELVRAGDQRLQIARIFRDGVAEKTHRSRVGDDAAAQFHTSRGASADSVEQFVVAFVAMHAETKSVAGVDISICCGANGVWRWNTADRGAVHHR